MNKKNKEIIEVEDTQEISIIDDNIQDSSVIEEEYNNPSSSNNTDSSTDDTQSSSITLVDARLTYESNGKTGRYNKLIVTDSDNKILKDAVENSMNKLEQRFIERIPYDDGRGYLGGSVTRNDSLLLSYSYLYVSSDYEYVHEYKTFDVDTGRELGLSDIITDMEMLPRAMYAECPSVREDYDDFITCMNSIIEDDELYWTADRFGVCLWPSEVVCAGIISAGVYHPFKYYNFPIVLNYKDYPQLLNPIYFDDSSKPILTRLTNNYPAIDDNTIEQIESLDNEKFSSVWEPFYSIPEVGRIAVLADDPEGGMNHCSKITVYNLDTSDSISIPYGDSKTVYISSAHFTKVDSDSYLLVSAYTVNDRDVQEKETTFAFKLTDNSITLTNTAVGLLNNGLGKASTNGFYMNSYDECFGRGLEEYQWYNQNMYKLNNQGVIEQV